MDNVAIAAVVVAVSATDASIVDNVDGISFIFSDGDDDDGEGDNDGSTEFNELKDSPSLSTALFIVVGGSEDEDGTIVSKFSSLLSTTLDVVVVGGIVVASSSSAPLLLVPVVALQPVMPAKQLCVMSEHSNRDPPGHGSHTLLALEAETPHYFFSLRWFALIL